MADSVLRKTRDYSSDMIDEDDPLMELSRIIGLEPRREQSLRREPEVALHSEPATIEPAADLPASAMATVEDEPLFDAHAEFDASAEIATDEVSVEFESIDDFQLDIADELIASLEAESGYSSPVSAPLRPSEQHADEQSEIVDQAAPEVDEVEPEYVQAEDPKGETIPHLLIHSNELPSIEDELQALLDASNDRKSPLGLRPVDQGIEDVEPVGSDYFGAFSTHANAARHVHEPVDIAAQPDDPRIDMNFDEDPEPGDPAEQEWDLPESAQEEFHADIVRTDSLIDSVETAEPAFEPELSGEDPHVFVAAAEMEYQEPALEPVDEPSFDSAAQPVVEAVQHEARSVEVTDEFDIPEFEYEEAGARVRDNAGQFAYDDEYTGSVLEPAPAAVSEEVASPVAAADFDEFELDQINDAIAELEQERAREFVTPETTAAAVGVAASWPIQARTERQDFVLERHGDPVASPDPLASKLDARKPVSARGYLMAAGLGALALVGGIAAYALTNGNVSPVTDSAPIVLKADSQPVKIAPENPGGSVVPNQDIAVYDKVGGPGAQANQQDQLVSSTEQPVNLQEKAAARVVLPGPSATETDEQAVKSEERIDPQSTQQESLVSGELATVSPKRVRTLVVKPDGSLVERTTPAPSFDEQTAAITPDLAKPSTEGLVPAKKVKTEAVDAAAAGVSVQAETAEAGSTLAAAPDAAPAEPIQTAAVAKTVPAPDPVSDPVAENPAVSSAEPTESVVAAVEPPAPAAAEAATAQETKPLVKTVKIKKIKAEPAATEIDVAAAANVPLVEARPADQPVNIVAKTGKTPGAEAAATPAASGNYVIQIASTPSPDAAQSTYASLSRKFGSVIGGRGVTIQKADIPGKGTFYRVRIEAGSKKEAVALCTKYKAAGGECLVAR